MVAIRQDAMLADVGEHGEHAWSFEEAYRELFEPMVKHAARLTHGDAEMAFDLTHDVWNRLCQPKHRATVEALPTTLAQRRYLFRVLKNRVIDHMRQRRNCPASHPQSFSHLQHSLSAESLDDVLAFVDVGERAPITLDVSELAEMRDRLRIVMRALRAETRGHAWKSAALELWLDGLEQKEIVARLKRFYPADPPTAVTMKKLSFRWHQCAQDILNAY